MSSTKRVLAVLGRLPLLFAVDSICRGTFLKFTFGFLGIGETYLPLSFDTDSDGGPYIQNLPYSLFIGIWLFFVIVIALILVCSPITSVLESYGCVIGATLTGLSYNCNKRYVNWQSISDVQALREDNLTESVVNYSSQTIPSTYLRAAISLVTQLFIMLGFDQICVRGILDKKKMSTVRYPVDMILFFSFSFPILLSSILADNSVLYVLSPLISAALPSILLLKYSISVFSTIFYETVLPGVQYVKVGIRELGLDGLIMQFTEHIDVAWLLRFFFAVQVFVQVVTSKTLGDSQSHLSDPDTMKHLTSEILYNLCSTLISVMSVASIISVISGMCLSFVYRLIQEHEEEEGLQPVISGFLFIILAMQTGITSISGHARLQLLFQNSILLVVANQHFVQSVAADLLVKASQDESGVGKHVRPLLTFCFFFTFPYFVVLPLWDYSFRLSWLLAITAFSIELIIKSVTSLLVYAVHMLHVHTNLLSDSIEPVLYCIQAISGCLEFICGIFLFVNGTYIFFFESGGFIRLFMMSIHFYCNIYQRSIKGWASYKLRISSWERVNKLRAAKQEELDNEEICSICYQDMSDAVALECSHIFHKSCLQKWLSIQNTCPLCHEKLKDLVSQQQQRPAAFVREAPL